MLSKSVNTILNKFGAFCRSDFVVDHVNDASAKYPLAEAYDERLVANLWYWNQRSIFECSRCNFYERLIESLKQYYVNDSQFPPDIVKCCRLYSLIREYNPSGILEIGCGTSSLVISKYLSDGGADASAMCVDASREWIEITKDKLDQVSFVNVDRIDWVEWSDNGCAKVKNFVKKNTKLFVYLDARLEDEDEFAGMGTLIKMLEGYSGDIVVLIDARGPALLALRRLSSVLNCKLAVASNCLFPSKPSFDRAFFKFHYMGSYTYVAKHANVGF